MSTARSAAPDRLLRAKELIGLPVVTLAGDDVAEVRDVVYDSGTATLVGFTLNKRGFLAGRHRHDLAIGSVTSLGRDAVMIDDTEVMTEPDEASSTVIEASTDRNVLGSVVLTDDGRRLGTVDDVVVLSGRAPRVEGYVLAPDRDSRRDAGQMMFIPLPDQIAVSGDALVVPAELAGFVRDDLAGFGAAIADFRASHPERDGPRRNPSPGPKRGDFPARSKAELYEEATRREIPGRSTMTKAELERALEGSP